MTPEERFARDIPEADQDDVLTRLSEAAHGCATHPEVEVIEIDRLDAVNVRAHLVLTWKGVSREVQLEDGNRNGTVLLAWDENRAFERSRAEELALVPPQETLNMQPARLLAQWDALLKRPEIAEIPGKLAYDRFMQPGSQVERHWREKAAKHGFDIGTADEANEIRRRLEQAAAEAAPRRRRRRTRTPPRPKGAERTSRSAPALTADACRSSRSAGMNRLAFSHRLG